jgi:hypothetical protein
LADCDQSVSLIGRLPPEWQSREFLKLTDRAERIAAGDLPMKIHRNPEAKRKKILIFQNLVEISLIFNGPFDWPDFLVSAGIQSP